MNITATALIKSLYDKAAENDDGCCDDCRFNHCWDEHHPYGMGTAAEHLCECRVDEAKNCPQVHIILFDALSLTTPKNNPEKKEDHHAEGSVDG